MPVHYLSVTEFARRAGITVSIVRDLRDDGVFRVDDETNYIGAVISFSIGTDLAYWIFKDNDEPD